MIDGGFKRDQPQNQVPQRLDTYDAKKIYLGLPNIVSKMAFLDVCNIHISNTHHEKIWHVKKEDNELNDEWMDGCVCYLQAWAPLANMEVHCW